MDKEQQIAALNDALRIEGKDGMVMATSAVANLSEDTRMAIFQAVKEFDVFNEDNDPYQEHDFGTLTVDKHRINWKIDYYDKTLEFGSENPSDPSITQRVLTIMMASDY